MNVKRNVPAYLLMIFLFLVGLASCRPEEPEEVADAAVPASPLTEVNQLAVGGFGNVSAEGEVVPLRDASLSFQLGGTVSEILVEEGDEVSAGDPLIRLDAGTLENALRQAEAGLVAAEAALEAAQAQLAVAEAGRQRAEAAIKSAVAEKALLESGATLEEIAAAEKNLAAAEAAIVQAAGNRDSAVNVSDAQVQAALAREAAAQAERDSLQEAYTDIIEACFETPDGGEICPLYGPVEEQTRAQLQAAEANLASAHAAVEEARAGATPSEVFLANSGVGVAMAARDQAQARLDLLLEGARDEQIQQAEVAVAQAEIGLEQVGAQIRQAEAAVTQAEAGVTKASADVEAAQKGLERMTLSAPFDGKVGDILTEVGALVGPGSPVMRFADFGGWLVKTTDLTELDVVAVKNGLPAEVRIDAIPGEVVNGVVSDISPVASLVRGDVTYQVTIDLEETDLPLRWGMTAAVDIIPES